MAGHFKGGRRNRFQQRSRVPRVWINDRIRAKEVRVVDEQGELLGVMPTAEALEKAKERELDLVEISPKAKPPVCKIIDYGKYQYEQKKKERIQRNASKGHEMKGIRLSFRIGPGDLERQQKNAEEFLTNGHPIRIQLIMKGREKAHKNLAFEKMKEFIKSVEEFGTLEQTPKLGGFQIVAIMKPNATKK